VSNLRNCSDEIVEDVLICQPTSITTAGEVDKVGFNQAEIMLYLLEKLSTVNNHLHLQPVTRMTYKQYPKANFLLGLKPEVYLLLLLLLLHPRQ